MQRITSFTDLLPHYDGFLIDLWGVIHDGGRLYKRVAESLEAIVKSGKRGVLLSNSPRRADRNIEALRVLGIPRNHYHDILTSGEATYQHIAMHHGAQRCYFMGDENADDADIMEDMPVMRVTCVDDADFVLNIGHYYPFQPLEELRAVLEQMHARSLLMLCANPDRQVVTASGRLYPCAGEIAEAYAAIGGEVQYFGKPYPDVYHQARELLGLEKKARILAIGDNLETDIRGGNAYGVDTLLITGGVLHAIMMDASGVIHHEALTQIVQENGNHPTYYCKQFGLR
jgi:HAD superfamily hydrolase (TIGR01459 family)